MRRNAVLGVLFAAVAVGLVGCAPRTYHHPPAPASLITGVRDFTVEPIQFDMMQVGRLAEAEYAERRMGVSHERYERDKQMLSGEFFARLFARSGGLRLRPGQAGGGGYTIRPMATFFEPGFYAGVAAEATELTLIVQVIDPAGRLVDQVPLREKVGAHWYSASRVERMREAVRRLADQYAAWLAERTGGPGAYGAY